MTTVTVQGDKTGTWVDYSKSPRVCVPTIQFKTGYSYTNGRAGRFTVKSRTEKLIVLIDQNGDTLTRRKIRVIDGVETCLPWGDYSQAPVLFATFAHANDE